MRLLVGTHAHSDHVGLAQWVIEASGCEFLMHPDTAHFYDAHALSRADRRGAAAAGAGPKACPKSDLPDYGDVAEEVDGVLAPVEPTRPIRDGDTIGRWRVVETPGTRPRTSSCSTARRSSSATCSPPRSRRGSTTATRTTRWPSSSGSLDRVEALGPFSLALPGHGRALEDVPAIIAEHRDGVATRLDATVAAIRDGADTGHEISRRLFGDLEPTAMVWRLTETMAYLRHLRLTGAISRSEDADGFFHYELSAVRA